MVNKRKKHKKVKERKDMPVYFTSIVRQIKQSVKKETL